MAHELILFHDSEAAFAPQYFGSVNYYALMASFGKVYVDIDMTADKRFKSAHRCRIVDTRDEIFLTAPIAHPHGRHSWNDTPVSAHGKWWNVHRTALESAYGRTPFFEYYIDRFAPIFDADYEAGSITVGQLDRQCDMIVREILSIDNDVEYCSPKENLTNDFRNNEIKCQETTGYYQLRSDRLGFRADLSILDLIFNMGPEAPMVMLETARKLHNAPKSSTIDEAAR